MSFVLLSATERVESNLKETLSTSIISARLVGAALEPPSFPTENLIFKSVLSDAAGIATCPVVCIQSASVFPG